MPTPVFLPKMEMSQEAATLVEWLKKDGESVAKGEPLYVVETDKVTVEVESPAAGTLAGLRAAPGETLPVTTIIAYILAPGESLDISLGETPPGLAVQEPAPAEQPVPAATPLAARMAAAEGLNLAALTGSGVDGKITRADVQQALSSQAGKVRASPAARRFAREQNLDLGTVTGSGPRGRIQGSDVLAHQAATPAAPDSSQSVGAVIPLQGKRRTIAERTLASYQQAPHVTFISRVDMTPLESIRANLNARAAQIGAVRTSLTALLVRITAAVLGNHPLLNARLVTDPGGAEIHLLSGIHIGVAVALEDGLIVPVVRDAGLKALRQVAQEVNELVEKARLGRLAPAEVGGGTFTISNLGPFGIEQFTAILNSGQSGILAVGAAVRMPVAVGTLGVDERVEIRPITHLTLSVDHRVVDGAVAAHFMADLKDALENPALALW